MSSRYRNVAFLAELLINILVFSISCAVLAGLFGQAGKLAGQTRSKSQATAEIYTLFETIRAEGAGALEEATLLENGSYALYYDKQWNPAGQNAAFTIQLTVNQRPTGAGAIWEMEAFAYDGEAQEICRLATKAYYSGEGAMEG